MLVLLFWLCQCNGREVDFDANDYMFKSQLVMFFKAKYAQWREREDIPYADDTKTRSNGVDSMPNHQVPSTT